MNKEAIAKAIERAVCDCVTTVFTVMRPGMLIDADPDTIYQGKTNITLSRACARHFSFYVMHDNFGFTYRQIAMRAGMSERAVMKQVRKVRQMVFIDQVYMELKRLMTLKQEDGIL